MILVKWSLVYILVSAALRLAMFGGDNFFVRGGDMDLNFTDAEDGDYRTDSTTTSNAHTLMTETSNESHLHSSVENLHSSLVNTTGFVVATAAQDEHLIPPIFIINLDRAKSRWDKVSSTMRNAGLTDEQITRLSAVDGRTLSLEELQNQSTKLAMFLQPRGVIGCYLSHRKFWQYVVDQRLERAIVLEDDIQLVGGFKDKLIESMRRMDPHDAFDVLFLGAIGRVHPQGKDNLGSILFSTYIGGNRELRTINDNLFQPRRAAGTHAYMVTYEGAKTLLALCPKATYHVDLDAWRHASLEIRMLNPMLVYQTFEDTSLTDFTSKRSSFNRYILESYPMKRLQLWARDTHTLQPWSHVLAEPLIQIGPGGPVITVERHCLVLGAGCVVAGLLQQQGLKYWAKVVLSSILGFTLGIRSIIWILMNWK